MRSLYYNVIKDVVPFVSSEQHSTCTSISLIMGQHFYKPVVGQTLFYENGNEDVWVLTSSFGLLNIVVLGMYLYIL